MRTMPRVMASLSRRETRGWEMLSAAAISGCRMPCSWYIRATRASSRRWSAVTIRPEPWTRPEIGDDHARLLSNV